MRPFEEEVAATQRWFDSPRFAGIVRLYAAHQGVEQRGTIASDHTVARQAAAAFHDRLRQLFAERKCITTFGPYSPGQAAAKVRGGIPYAIAKSMAPALRRGALDGDLDRRPRRRPPVRRGDPHRVPR